MGDSSVCVVGASFGGVSTAKVFLRDGFDVTVYEKSDEIGGTWSSNRRYIGLKNQNSHGIFELIGKRWGDGYTPAEHVQQYLREYAAEFDVVKAIDFETEVASVARDGDGWRVEIRDCTGDESPVETERFDYVVVASGAYDIPHVPEFPGQDAFDGDVYHSSEVQNVEQIGNEDVVVVGGGTSAYELSAASARVAASTTMVFRRAHWMLPLKLWGIVPRRYLVYTRLGEALLPCYYNEDTWRLPDRVLRPVKGLIASAIEHGFIEGAGYDELPDELVPEKPPLELRPRGVMPEGFVPAVRSGRIVPKNEPVERFTADGLQLASDEHVDADVVVMATGYEHRYPFLPDDLPVKNDDGQFRLYRGIVPPEAEGLGILGRRELYNNFLSMQISAHWLSDYFRGNLVETPTTGEMYETIDRRLEWMDGAITEHRGYFFAGYHFHSIDELLVDMGVETRRQDSILSEWLRPTARARSYEGLHEERKRAND